jgi:hypothetical protein
MASGSQARLHGIDKEGIPVVFTNRRLIRTLPAWALFPVLMLAGATASADTIGLQLIAHRWDPFTNDDNPERLVNNPRFITDNISRAWRNHSAEAIERLKSEMQAPDKIADGVTLYDVVLNVPQPTLVMEGVRGGDEGSQSIRMTLRFAPISIATSATQPAVGRWADPRCSARFNLELVARVTVGRDVHRPFSVDMSVDAGDKPIVITGFDWDNEDSNTVCDIARGVATLLGWDRLITHAVNSAVDNRSFRAMAIDAIRKALDAANGVAANIPPGLVKVRTWVTGDPDNRLLTVYFAPAPVPAAGPRTTIRGTLKNSTPRELGGSGTATCDALGLSVERITGPRPVLNPSLGRGEAPRAPVTARMTCNPVPPGSTVHYEIRDLPATTPLLFTLNTAVSAGQCGGTGLTRYRRQLIAVSASGHVKSRNEGLAPVDFGNSQDLEVQWMETPCGAAQVISQLGPFINHGIRESREIRISTDSNPSIATQPAGNISERTLLQPNTRALEALRIENTGVADKAKIDAGAEAAAELKAAQESAVR